MGLRTALALVLTVVVGLGAGTCAHAAERYGWSYDRLMRRIDGVHVQVAEKRYRVDRDLVVCDGVGRAIRSGRERRWSRFVCTQTILRPTVTDITFRVRVIDERRFRVSDGRYGP